MNNLINRFLVCLCLFGNYVNLITLDCRHGRSRFLLNPEKLSRLCNNHSIYELDNDLNNFCVISRDNDVIYFRLVWSDADSADNTHGFIQRFSLPVESLKLSLSGATYKHVVYQDVPLAQSKLVFSKSAQALIRRIISNKKMKRALSKAIARSFHYGDVAVMLYDDGLIPYSFYFSCSDGLCGGLVYSCNDGKASFNIHT